jgi:raffinose/stachyose/melibiose transport system substrate-binding protein
MQRNAVVVLRGLALALGATIALTSCTGGAPGSQPGNVQQQTTGPQELRYMVAQPEDAKDVELLEKKLDEFEQQNKGVTVKLDVVPTDNLRTVLQTQLRSGEGPDIFDYDTGPGFAGALAEAGLLYDLTEAYQQHGWQVYDFAKQRVTFDDLVVGIPGSMEEVGIFYNKDLFAEHGIAEPGSLPELQQAAKKLAAADVIPMAVSDKEGWQGGHLLSMSLASAVGSQQMNEYITGGKPWNSPEVVAAIKTWKDLADAGALTPSPTAVNYDNANALFYKQKAAMNPTGSWMISDIEKNADFEVGFIPFPAPDGPGIFCGGLGSGVFLSASSDNAEAGIKLLDFMASEEFGRWEIETRKKIPAYPVDTSGLEESELFTNVLNDTAELAEGEGDFGYNIDVLTPDGFNNAMWQGMQGILTGQQDPQQVADRLQDAYEREQR